jgi:hypothetical protein
MPFRARVVLAYLTASQNHASCVTRNHMHAFRFRFFGPPIAVHQVFQPISYKHDSETCDLVLHHMTIPAKTCASLVLADINKGQGSFKPATCLTSCSPSAATAIILSGSGAALFLHGLSFAIPAYRPLPAHALVIEVVFAFPVLVSYRSSRPTRDHHTETEASLPLASGESSGGLCCCLSSARCLAHCLSSTLTFPTEFDVATGPTLSRKQHRNPSHASNNPQARD